MDIQQYLTRFNAMPTHKASLSTVTGLQHQHLQHIPFENLDVIRKVPIYLNLQNIFSKIVHSHRGGYCYELNGLFNWLLSELGFCAHLVAATVLRPNGQWAKTDTHATILVQLDQPYLVDVGFGAATPRTPIPLDGSERTDLNGTYKVMQVTECLFDLIQDSESGTKTLYRFNTDEKKLVDFHEGCIFNQVDKASTFTHHDIVSIATNTGRITLADNTLTVVENGIKKTSQLSNEDKSHVLQTTFKLYV
ncbi:arylamine N-acetyltransferase family protein [Sporosarcina beigongshangi]|uniref:arylamine N-acetyltransferase family protein n=1 Tax=Sporosarcina beigongshangi TaxID=2782538 RepID=UPI00193A2D40|nr:arylamine N-acetyltransferase [Sporosarcina beigongshangi]